MNVNLELLKMSEEDNVEYSNGCYTIQGNSDYITRVVDKIILMLYGAMK